MDNIITTQKSYIDRSMGNSLGNSVMNNAWNSSSNSAANKFNSINNFNNVFESVSKNYASASSQILNKTANKLLTSPTDFSKIERTTAPTDHLIVKQQNSDKIENKHEDDTNKKKRFG